MTIYCGEYHNYFPNHSNSREMKYEHDKWTLDLMRFTPYHPNQRLEAARREIAEMHRFKCERCSELFVDFGDYMTHCFDCEIHIPE